MSITPNPDPFNILARLPPELARDTIGFLDQERQSCVMIASKYLYETTSSERINKTFSKSLLELKTIAEEKSFQDKYPKLQAIVEKIFLSGNNITKNDKLTNIFEINRNLRHLYNPAVQTANKCRKIFLNETDGILRSLSNSLANGGNFDEALEIAKAISEPSKQALALRSISHALFKAGHLENALDVAQTISEENIKRSTINEISLAFANIKNFDKAIEIAQTISIEQGQAVNFTLLDPTRVRGATLTSIAIKLVKDRQFKRAIKVVSLCDKCCQDDVLVVISRERCEKDKNFDEAIRVTSRISGPTHKSTALQEISEGLAKSGDPVRAIGVANTIPVISYKKDALNHICLDMPEKKTYQSIL